MIFSSQFFYVFSHPFDADHDPVLKMEKEFIYIAGFRNGSAAECNSSSVLRSSGGMVPNKQFFYQQYRKLHFQTSGSKTGKRCVFYLPYLQFAAPTDSYLPEQY